MSGKIFNSFLIQNLKNPKYFHLYPTNRLAYKNPNYTRDGDSGKSLTHNGELHKDHKLFEAIGAAEELSAYIGLAREFVKEDDRLLPVADILRKVQLVLVDIIHIINSLHVNGSEIDATKVPMPAFEAKITAKDVSDLELLITHYSNYLPPVEHIIIPGGGKASATLQVARTISRRCERALVAVFKNIKSADLILTYINRLSPYLNQAARISAKFADRSETVYKPRKREELATGDK